VREGTVSNDPLADFQMPPDVEIENRKLQDKGASSHGA
jgi:hypothetical protein